MPFNNPVVAGEELIRSSMRSENFQSSTESETGEGAGWAVFRDGRAEFNAITVRGNTSGQSAAFEDLSASNEIYYQGNALSDLLDAKNNGPVAYGAIPSGPTRVIGEGSGAALLDLAFTCSPDRLYTFEILPFRAAPNVNGVNMLIELRYRTDENTNTAVTDPALFMHEETTYGDNFINMSALRTIAGAVFTSTEQMIKVGVWFRVIETGGSYEATIPAVDGVQLMIHDVGPWTLSNTGVNRFDGGGSSATYRKFFVGPYASRSYDGSGANIGYEDQYAMQGDIGIDGNRRSWIWFDANATGTGNGGNMNDMQGAASLDYFDVYLNYDHWYFATGTAVIGCHNSNLVTATEQGGAVYDRKRVGGWARDEGRWVSLLGTDIATEALAGRLEGIVLGNTGSADREFYGYAHGANGVGGQAPGLRAGYYK